MRGARRVTLATLAALLLGATVVTLPAGSGTAQEFDPGCGLSGGRLCGPDDPDPPDEEPGTGPEEPDADPVPSTQPPTTVPGDQEGDTGDIDVGGAILDALDDDAVRRILTSPVLLEALGCTELTPGSCEAVAVARAEAQGFLDLIPGLAVGAEQIHRRGVARTLAGAAVIGALRDGDGELIFPTLMASVPVLTRLAVNAARGGPEELEVLTTFGNILLSLDARARGLVE